MKLIGLLAIVIVLALSCASNDYAPEQRYEHEANQAISRENWELCKAVYANAQVATVSRHPHRRGLRHRSWQVTQDLVDNHCRFILRHYWIDRE